MALERYYTLDTQAFEEWIGELEHFALWGEDDEDGIEWVAAAACQTEEIANIVCQTYAEEGTQTKVGTRYDIDYQDFVGNIRENLGVALFSTKKTPGRRKRPLVIMPDDYKPIVDALARGGYEVFAVELDDRALRDFPLGPVYGQSLFDEVCSTPQPAVVSQDGQILALCRDEETAKAISKAVDGTSLQADTTCPELAKEACLAVIDGELDEDPNSDCYGATFIPEHPKPIVITTSSTIASLAARSIEDKGSAPYIATADAVDDQVSGLGRDGNLHDFVPGQPKRWKGMPKYMGRILMYAE